MPRRLALFDLDNTLLAGDSDHAFGEYLIERGLVDAGQHRAENDRYYRDYTREELDIHAYVRFTLGPVMAMSGSERERLQRDFSARVIDTMVSEASRQLVTDHRNAGDYCVIITATNDFITGPLATAYAVDTLLATELETNNGRLTGRIRGIPCFREGKLNKLQQWLNEQASLGLSLDNSVFYSDSSNDLPLLERVTEAVVVDADASLRQVAQDRGWRQLALHGR